MDEKNNGIEDLVLLAKPIVDKIVNELYQEYFILDYQVKKQVFNDSSLGLPEKGKTYAQMMTPGYELILELFNKEKEEFITKTYHTNLSGTLIKENKKTGNDGLLLLPLIAFFGAQLLYLANPK